MKNRTLYFSLVATLMAGLFNIQTSYADSQIQVQAATGCFPRVFSQIGFFKSSNGGLRNDSSTPKTIVCSVHVPDHTGTYDANLLNSDLQVWPYFSFNNDLEDIPCTLYTRDGANNTLFTETDSGTFSGQTGFIGLFVDRVGLGNEFNSYNYFQCTLPAGVAITQYNIYHL